MQTPSLQVHASSTQARPLCTVQIDEKFFSRTVPVIRRPAGKMQNAANALLGNFNCSRGREKLSQRITTTACT